MRLFAILIASLFGIGEIAFADLEIRLSVKFILNSQGTRPVFDPGSGGFDISNEANFGTRINLDNNRLVATGRGYRIRVIEYIDIQPTAPQGNDADYWYNLNARGERATIEAAAINQTGDPWRWNQNAINIYVNNSSSGQCSFVGSGMSIALGANIFSVGTIIHEIGHFHNLRHTHDGDPDCRTFAVPNPPTLANLGPLLTDGDNLAATTPDHPCFTRDQLSIGTFGSNYASLTAAQQAVVNSAWLNVMSYHQDNQLLDDQMDIWTQHANGARLLFVNGKTWFVANGGSDGASGAQADAAFASLMRGLNAVTTPNDVLLLKSGTFLAPASGKIATPCTLRATRGPVTITR